MFVGTILLYKWGLPLLTRIHPSSHLPTSTYREREMECQTLSRILATILILLQCTIYMTSCSAARAMPNNRTNQFIKTSCNSTRYPQLCYNSLSVYATKIQTNPKLLANMALNITLYTTRHTSDMMKNLSETANLRPKEASALRDCLEQLSDSVDELQRSIGEMNYNGSIDFGLQMSDIQTWVSAALTNEDTCMDGFAGDEVNGNMKTLVRRHIVKVAEMTSNALALINNYASTHNPYQLPSN